MRAHGAVSSTTADNQAALQRAFNAAKAAGKAVFVPGGTFRHSGQLVLDGVDLWGEGPTSVLVGLDPANESLNVRGTRAGVHAVKLVSGATARLTTPWSGMVWVDRASQFDVGCVTVEGSASVAVFASDSQNGKIHDNVATRTLADSIHLTGTSNQIEITRNHIEYSGDDGIACVSYGGVAPGNGPETNYVRDVKAWDNVILYNRGGRAMSVVGGRRIEYWNNYLRGGTMQTACIYLAQEGSYDTWEANGVHIHDNRLIECGGSVHPASLLVYAGQWPNRDIRIENNSFWRNRGGAGAVSLQGTNINVTQSGTGSTSGRSTGSVLIDRGLTAPGGAADEGAPRSRRRARRSRRQTRSSRASRWSSRCLRPDRGPRDRTRSSGRRRRGSRTIEARGSSDPDRRHADAEARPAEGRGEASRRSCRRVPRRRRRKRLRRRARCSPRSRRRGRCRGHLDRVALLRRGDDHDDDARLVGASKVTDRGFFPGATRVSVRRPGATGKGAAGSSTTYPSSCSTRTVGDPSFVWRLDVGELLVDLVERPIGKARRSAGSGFWRALSYSR